MDLPIPPGTHLFGVPPQAQLQKTERLITFKNCRVGFVVNVDQTMKVVGYEMHTHDPQEGTIYVFGFDQKIRDTFLDQLVSLPDIGTVPDGGGDNGRAA